MSWCQWPRALEGRPLWERVEYTALHGARLSSVPSGDQSANPASVPGRSGLQRALLSVSSARKRSGAERLAAPFLGSLEQLEWPSPAGPLLQGTELAALSTPEASLERLVPLVDYSAAWKLLPNVSRWVMHTVEQGYRGALPLPFNGVTPMLVGPEQARRKEEGGHRGGPSSRQRVRVLQPYFIVPGKGVASFLDLS